MPDPITASVVLGYVAIKTLDSLIEKGVDETVDVWKNRLKGDNTQKSFKICLAQAISRYSQTGNRYFLAKPLLSNNSPFLQEDVARELAHTIKFDREPNYDLISKRWRDTIEGLPNWWDMNYETKLLLHYLNEELQVSETFGPVFDSKNLKAINESVCVTASAVANIEKQTNDLINLIESKFGDLLNVFSSTNCEISKQIIDFGLYIQEKSQDFVGREFLFNTFEQFISKHDEGYLIVKGDPGIGKTSLTAQYVKENGYIHHFNIRPLGINRTELFLTNICAQLIAKYHLNYSFLPPEATKDSQFLIKLLTEVSQNLESGKSLVIVVDALDEVDNSSSMDDANTLFLPTDLPKGVYFILTARNTELRLRISGNQQTIFIHQDSSENLDDIRKFITQKINLKGIQDYINSLVISSSEFIELLAEKSQGNFIYLRYIIPDINAGLFKDLKMDVLPIGLQSYYEDHWRRMRTISENDWFEFKLPVIVALSISKVPISLDVIADFSGVQDKRHIISVLDEWQQFLFIQTMVMGNVTQKRWRVYHDSFREFIANKDLVKEERIDLVAAHKFIANNLWNELFGEG